MNELMESLSRHKTDIWREVRFHGYSYNIGAITGIVYSCFSLFGESRYTGIKFKLPIIPTAYEEGNNKFAVPIVDIRTLYDTYKPEEEIEISFDPNGICSKITRRKNFCIMVPFSMNESYADIIANYNNSGRFLRSEFEKKHAIKLRFIDALTEETRAMKNYRHSKGMYFKNESR
jgi:hypothetical protein